MTAAATSWAVRPLDMNGAAEALGVCRRTLTYALGRYPFYESRGRKKVFYPEHIDQLRKAMRECDSRSSGSTDGHRPMGPALTAGASENLSRLATLAARKKPARI